MYMSNRNTVVHLNVRYTPSQKGTPNCQL